LGPAQSRLDPSCSKLARDCSEAMEFQRLVTPKAQPKPRLKDWQLPDELAVEVWGRLVAARWNLNWLYWNCPASFDVT
jgi:hypothetical protein